jgi:hypothetical protein
MGQLYDDHIKNFCNELEVNSRVDPEKCAYPVYRLDDGGLVGQPVHGVSSFYHLTGKRKGQVYDRSEESLQPVNAAAFETLSAHYEVDGVTPGVGLDGRRYVKNASPGNAFNLKAGDRIPNNWKTYSIW